jgi:hypothetical protein
MSRWITIVGCCLLVGLTAAWPQEASAKSSHSGRSVARSVHRNSSPKRSASKHAYARKTSGKRHHNAKFSHSQGKRPHRHAAYRTGRRNVRFSKASAARRVGNSSIRANAMRRWMKPTKNSRRPFSYKKPVNANKPPTKPATVSTPNKTS